MRYDLSTGTAQRERISLPDGSSLLLNARSAADLNFDGRKRDIELLSGGAIVDVRASDHDALRLCSHLGVMSMSEGRCMMML
ncbi:FecR domain-containing protein, partial [Pseudomonas sp. SIMBA_044]|uniref:FecR domain-containing protein n=1 Tax=Pseudomonas sp. SIMBA_044 TaxID=3085785 RepID=UPI00397DD732